MLKQKLHWKRPFFLFIVLPIFMVIAFLGFPLPLAPPPKIQDQQEQATPVKKRRKKPIQLIKLSSKNPNEELDDI
jgi:hypothetical protein